MHSKGVLDRQRVARAVIAATRVHAEEVGQRLHAELAVVLEDGDTPPDLTRFQMLLAQLLEQRLESLLAAEERHRMELDDDGDARMRRDEASATVQRQIIALREAVSAVYGSDRVPLVLGIDGPTPQTPLVLHRQAQRTLDLLERPVEMEPQTELLSAEQLDFTGAAERLQEAATALDRALEKVALEAREAETTLRDRDEAIEAFDLTVGGVGLAHKAFLFLAGLPELAERTRVALPRHRSKARRQSARRFQPAVEPAVEEEREG